MRRRLTTTQMQKKIEEHVDGGKQRNEHMEACYHHPTTGNRVTNRRAVTLATIAVANLDCQLGVES